MATATNSAVCDSSTLDVKQRITAQSSDGTEVLDSDLPKQESSSASDDALEPELEGAAQGEWQGGSLKDYFVSIGVPLRTSWLVPNSLV